MICRAPRAAGAAAAAAVVLMATVPGTLAGWTDSSEATVPATAIVALDVAEPVLTCTVVGSSAVVSWPVATYPTTLNYAATVKDAVQPTVLNGTTRSVTVDPSLISSLLGALLGGSTTVKVTAQLPGSAGWTSETASLTVNYTALTGEVTGVTCPA